MLLALGIPVAGWCADGDTFTVTTTEGLAMTMMVLSETDKTCQVGDGERNCIEQAYTGSVTIPQTANGYAVTAIGSYAFYNYYHYGSGDLNVTSVNIPEGVTAINRYAFDDQRELKTIELPSTLRQIDEYAFNGSGLTAITLPEGMTSIGASAFYNDRLLTGVTLPSEA